MTLGVVAPFYQQAGRVEPYLTTTEVTFSATAAALDFTQLVPNGDDAQQLASLQELIVRASSKIDAYTMGKLGTVNATVNTENGRYRVTRDGTFRVHPSFTPILQVMTFSWGQQPGAVFDGCCPSHPLVEVPGEHVNPLPRGPALNRCPLGFRPEGLVLRGHPQVGHGSRLVLLLRELSASWRHAQP